ncbi:MAG: ester cyclase, partial [Sphingomonas sp.]
MTVPGVAGRDIAALLAPQGARRQPLDGYDADYADIVDYIIRCTHRIWEQKDIGLIKTHYADDCRMHLMTGPIDGAGGVVANTIRTLAAFPDRTLVGEAVIWSEEAGGAYLSSHRITSSGTNLGISDFGPATGRRVQFTTIADCLCRENRIVEEWLVRDNSGLVLGLGLSPRRIARDQAARDKENGGRATWRAEAMQRVRDRPAARFLDSP